jgi:YD repeat-containing protein
VVVYDGSDNRDAETDYSYDGSSLTGTSSVINHDYSNYGSSYTNRGNATAMSKWVNTSGSSLTWNYTYDDTGQELSMADPKGNSTGYSYTDAFPVCGSPSGSTNAYVTKITDAKGFTQSFTYRYCDGQLNTAIDRNTQTTTYSYADSLDRLTSISYPDKGLTTYGYASSGACSQPSTTTILIEGSSDYTETATLDGVCHVIQTAITSDSQPDYTDTTYDGLGRVWKVSNPYRSTGDSTYGLTTYAYDPLGRTTSVAYADGSTASTSYSGDTSTVTDAAGKTRTLTSDGLGRLTSVAEDPSGLNYSSSYTYNALNDLLTVSQGSQTRTFVYDSLSRLTSATNPESGLTSYTYPSSTGSGICSGDPSSVCTRTDARSIITTYTYNDALNRLTSKSYSDGTTPTAAFKYDETGVTLGSWTSPSLLNYKGRLTHTTTTSGSTILTATVQDYDPMGRTQHYWQCSPYNCGSSSIWAMPFTYDLAGDVLTWTHPAGFTVTNTISNARRITQIASSLVDSNHPANFAQNITYTPWGALSTLTNGCAGSGCTNTMETYTYNKRLETSQIQLGTTGNPAAYYTLGYNYALPGGTQPTGCPINPQGTSGNNGNVIGYTYTDTLDSTLSHSAFFVYDTVNRLACAQATGNSTYNLAYGYNQDGSGQYGNMTCVYNSYTNGPCRGCPLVRRK